jgi:hypothetical protein
MFLLFIIVIETCWHFSQSKSHGWIKMQICVLISKSAMGTGLFALSAPSEGCTAPIQVFEFEFEFEFIDTHIKAYYTIQASHEHMHL